MIFSKPSQNPRFEEPPPDKVDKLLYRFFRSEMAEPWPACPALPPERQTTTLMPSVLRRLRLPRRVAVAAAVVLLVAGYGELKKSFTEPRHVSTSAFLPSEQIGMQRTLRGVDRTPSGRPVKFQMDWSPDNKTILLQIQELPVSK